jgi:ABC-type transport system involved in cytochrome c biogenesis permease component
VINLVTDVQSSLRSEDALYMQTRAGGTMDLVMLFPSIHTVLVQGPVVKHWLVAYFLV